MESRRLLSPFNRSRRVDLILQKAAKIQNKGLHGHKNLSFLKSPKKTSRSISTMKSPCSQQTEEELSNHVKKPSLPWKEPKAHARTRLQGFRRSNTIMKKNSKINLNRYIKSSSSKSRENLNRSERLDKHTFTRINFSRQRLTNSFSKKKITVAELNNYLNLNNTEDSRNGCFSEDRSPRRIALKNERIVLLSQKRRSKRITQSHHNLTKIFNKKQKFRKKRKITGIHDINIHLELKFNPMVLLNNGYKHYRYIPFSKK
ncbi:unnamed protein product [Moneuplotes crassus]|uniref:Uncharacterized protein n=1 Tax=Euplotes crassus TaxID=5936 RepID=A0AAD1U7I3_EUPCR|nr:unnamed protein product [Moneuplotes crassus]